jgi:hypothetical protein
MIIRMIIRVIITVPVSVRGPWIISQTAVIKNIIAVIPFVEIPIVQVAPAATVSYFHPQVSVIYIFFIVTVLPVVLFFYTNIFFRLAAF